MWAMGWATVAVTGWWAVKGAAEATTAAGATAWWATDAVTGWWAVKGAAEATTGAAAWWATCWATTGWWAVKGAAEWARDEVKVGATEATGVATAW